MNAWRTVAVALATTTAGAGGGAAVYEARQSRLEDRMQRVERKVDALVCLESKTLCEQLAGGNGGGGR